MHAGMQPQPCVNEFTDKCDKYVCHKNSFLQFAESSSAHAWREYWKKKKKKVNKKFPR